MTCLGAFVASAERGLCGAQPRAGFHLLGRRGLRARCVFAPYLCVWSWGCARSRCVRWAPPGGDDPADHGPRRWFGAQAHAGCACIRPVSQDSRLASSLLRTVRTLADGVWESPHGASPSRIWVRPSPVPPTRARSLPDRSDRSPSPDHVIHASKASNLEAELSKCIRPVWGSQATRTLH